MAKFNKTQFAILGMLSIEPMSGYAMRQTMRQSTANFWSESDGQLYPTLAKLEVRGYIALQASTKGRDKKIYALTALGQEVLAQWLALPPEKHNIRNEFMLKVFYGANVKPAVTLAHIQMQRNQTATQMHELESTLRKITLEQANSPHFRYWQLTLHYGIQVAKTKLQWCDEAMRELAALE